MATPDTHPDFDALWEYDHPAETETRFRDLLAQTSTADRGYLAELLTQIARTEGLQRRFADAHRTLDAARDLLSDDLHRARVRYLLERGRVHNSARESASAQPFFTAAWELASAHGEDFHAIDAAHMLAIVESGEAQLAWHLRALALAERSTDPHARGWRGSLYNNLGWTYHDAGEFEQALPIFRRALAYREETGRPPEIVIARWAVARTLRSLGRLAEALAEQQELRHATEATGAPDGYINEELAECLLALGRADEAQPHFARAYALLSADPWLAENEPARLQRLKELGQDAEGV